MIPEVVACGGRYRGEVDAAYCLLRTRGCPRDAGSGRWARAAKENQWRKDI